MYDSTFVVFDKRHGQRMPSENSLTNYSTVVIFAVKLGLSKTATLNIMNAWIYIGQIRLKIWSQIVNETSRTHYGKVISYLVSIIANDCHVKHHECRNLHWTHLAIDIVIDCQEKYHGQIMVQKPILVWVVLNLVKNMVRHG